MQNSGFGMKPFLVPLSYVLFVFKNFFCTSLLFVMAFC
jgi:hypothetical protein